MTTEQKQYPFSVLIVALVSGLVGGLIGTYLYLFYGGYPLPHATTEFFEEEIPVAMEINHDEILFSNERHTIDVVQQANPAVVSIVVSKEIQQQNNGLRGNPFNDFFFNIPSAPFFLEELPEEEETREPIIQQVGGGSGFIYSEDGLIVTNKHVVDDDSASYTVMLSDGREYEAEVLAKDPIFDLAILNINESNLPTLPLGDSDGLQLGEEVIAIGYALAEFGNTVTVGVVSGIDRRIEAGNGYGLSAVINEAIQTDAAINPGNSGGPLLNSRGEVIGINTAVSNRGQSLGFAISINSVKNIIKSVEENGTIVRPWLGVRYVLNNPRMAEVNNLSVDYGAIVLRGESKEELAVIPGSPADKAGLVENDIILSINGEQITQENPLAENISSYAVGDTLNMTILHDGEEKELTVTLESFVIGEKDEENE